MEKLSRQDREQIQRRELLISTAEVLFLKKGYEETSIDDLAQASEYTKRTLYRYFTCKEDLYYAVTLRGYRNLLHLIGEKSAAGRTGYEKACLAIEAYYLYYQNCPEMLKLISQSGAVKTRSASVEVPYRSQALAYESELFQTLLQLFVNGQADGSIRDDREAMMLAFSSIFMTAGFFQLLSQTGISYTHHFGLDMKAFVRCAMEMITEYLYKRQ